MALYLDTAATTPVDPRVVELVVRYMRDEYGNAGSRTHQMGATAKSAVERAREQVAMLVRSDPSEVVFTSGATESNNIAILGMKSYGERMGRRHIVSTAIEHKAVLGPLEWLERQGWVVTLVAAGQDGLVDTASVLGAIRPDTALVSMMHVNNETGVIQPIREVAAALPDDVFLHVDAAQSFGKLIDDLQNPRIDMVSASGHKLFAPKGTGALITRRRARKRPPIEAIVHGGGQERGIRPGTLAVPLIVGFGEACHLAAAEHGWRSAHNAAVGAVVLERLTELGGRINGTATRVPHILNVSFPGLDSEAAILLLKEIAYVSNGSACTSEKYEPSHVLLAMGLERSRCLQAIRISWGHHTAAEDMEPLFEALRASLASRVPSPSLQD
jgi:cysteine desulfurase